MPQINTRSFNHCATRSISRAGHTLSNLTSLSTIRKQRSRAIDLPKQVQCGPSANQVRSIPRGIVLSRRVPK